MSDISTPAKRAHLRCCLKLAHSITTHSAPIQAEPLRGRKTMTPQQELARGRTGKKTGGLVPMFAVVPRKANKAKKG